MPEARNVRMLCWQLIVLAIVAAVLTIMLTFAIFLPPPPVEGPDLVDNLLAFRLGDQTLFPFVFLQSLATAGVFLTAALLGPMWRTLSQVIGVVLLAAVVVRALASFVFISAFDPFQVTDLVVAITLAVLVPIWAYLLARGGRPMTETAAV